MLLATVEVVTEDGRGPKVSLIERGTIPAGWYPDQSGVDQLRWWDGQQWSTEVRPLVIDMVPNFTSAPSTSIRLASTPERSTPAPHDGSTLTRRQLREILGGPLTTEPTMEHTRF